MVAGGTHVSPPKIRLIVDKSGYFPSPQLPVVSIKRKRNCVRRNSCKLFHCHSGPYNDKTAPQVMALSRRGIFVNETKKSRSLIKMLHWKGLQQACGTQKGSPTREVVEIERPDHAASESLVFDVLRFDGDALRVVISHPLVTCPERERK